MLRRHTWRQATVAGIIILVVISVVAYMRQNSVKHQVNPSQAQPGAKPGVQGAAGARMLPESAPFDVLRPRYPIDDAVRYPSGARPAAAQPARTAGTGAPMFPPDISEEGVIHLAVPPTQVHSLAEAATVMGLDSASAAEVGISRTKPLPPEAQPVISKTEAAPVSAPLNSAASSIGAPPGVPPDEVGKTKTKPVPPDRKPQ